MTTKDCPTCDGEGRVRTQDRGTIEMGPCWYSRECDDCNGSGRVPDLTLCQQCGEELDVAEGDVCAECCELNQQAADEHRSEMARDRAEQLMCDRYEDERRGL